MRIYRTTIAFAVMILTGPSLCFADSGVDDQIIITGTRFAHTMADIPAAVDVVDTRQIQEAGPRVNVSEALAAVPGLVVQNRQNYAQDLQISSRGFGARSAFGVRGVRFITDGIPATTPDGQGQAATFNLDVADRIEVLRGPFAVTYGNHAGGVVQLFTREGAGPPRLEVNASAGSYGSWKVDSNLQGRSGPVAYLLDTSRFQTDGYRDHSAATRDQGYAKLVFHLDPGESLMLVANSLHQKDTQDPLGLTWAGVMQNRRGVDPSALLYNTRKSIDHLQAGLAYSRKFDGQEIQIVFYGGTRHVVQYQAIPKAAQASPRSPGGVVAFDRNFNGLNLRWMASRSLATGVLTTTVGLDVDRSEDERKGFENFIGSQLGVMGRLRRNETDRVGNFDPYAQAEWSAGRWELTAGVRHSEVRFRVADHYLSNGDDSGSFSYSATTPMLGLVYKLDPRVNLYASMARGFETPTFNEMFYSAAGGGFNYGLRPARSNHFEAGIKTTPAEGLRLNLAWFRIRTEGELVVDQSTGGRTSYRNAGNTSREGYELSLDTSWARVFSARLALTGITAIYDNGFTSGAGVVTPGRRLPGVPADSAFGEIVWRDPASGYSAGVELQGQGRIFVEDTNRQRPASGYAVANLRVGAQQKSGAWTTSPAGSISPTLVP
ncbi:MAG TPA: TonB-dependent receptor [Rhodocyclaceae bacterium]|nr:TonB-dependent receptor [Rhodocyclaceae bacterium]